MSSQSKRISCFLSVQPLCSTLCHCGRVVPRSSRNSNDAPCGSSFHLCRGVKRTLHPRALQPLSGRNRFSSSFSENNSSWRRNKNLLKAAVTEIESQEQLDQELEKAGSKLTIVDFSTTWCGPCKVVAPKYEELSEKYQQVVFLKVIGDKNGETNKIMKSFGIRAVPTFKFMKGKKSIHEVAGARIDALEDGIKSYM
ncbi:hypothetical protein GAYE_PCTG50G1179 [Galdieria yellowstonensis]|uniref:Thioredoxin domain-containing protein n=1 Tax=Galdieria yellowstonensis TaxID=3028027 RepID=A0AAV9I411_9RHOD|nr:hypothetical protein GAYE_PCTG50G1179 [Galdieria yellowstonensis]